MFNPFLQFLAQDLGFLDNKHNTQKPSITIQIPKDHPKAESFLKLANLLATSKVTQDGVYIKGLYNPDAEKQLLEALSDFVDIDEVVKTVKQKHWEQLSPAERSNFNATDPKWAGKLLETAIASKVLNAENTSNVEKLLNKARADQGKSNIIDLD